MSAIIRYGARTDDQGPSNGFALAIGSGKRTLFVVITQLYFTISIKYDMVVEKQLFTHTTLFTKAWQIQNIDISVRKEKKYIYTNKK